MAEHAAEQGREVFAVPGNADSDASQGTLKLIRDGARLVRSADDIIEDLSGLSPLIEPARPSPTASAAPAAPAAEPPQMDETQRRVWDQLAGGPPQRLRRPRLRRAAGGLQSVRASFQLCRRATG